MGGIDIKSAVDSYDYIPEPMPKLEFIMNEMLNEISYISLCALRIPINEDCLDYNKRRPFIEAVNFSTNNLNRWNVLKIVNAVSMLRLIDAINMKERELYNANIGSVVLDRYKKTLIDANENGKMFNLVDTQKRAIKSQIKDAIQD